MISHDSDHVFPHAGESMNGPSTVQGDHGVTVLAGGLGGLGNNRPVVVPLNLRLDVADGGAEVGATESGLCFSSGKSLTSCKVVHDSTLSGVGTGHNEYSKICDEF